MNPTLLALLLAALVTQPLAAATPTGEHVVRPGETLEGITAKYLGSSKQWREVWKLNPEVRNPNMLKPGQRIRVLLPDSLPASSALVARVARRVQKKPDPEPWQPARAGDRLQERHGIQTLEQSSAELRFQDETLLTLTERSLVFLRGMQKPALPRDRSQIELVEGQGDLERRAGRVRSEDIEITVGTAVATPSPGNARARFRAAPKSAKVMSYSGSTSVSGAGRAVKVAEGMGVSVPEGGAPSAPEKLLAAPVLESLEIDVPRPALRWPAVAGAAKYTVEICRDRRCAEVVARETALARTEWTPPEPLAAAKLFWRVTAESASGLDGYPAVAPMNVRLSLSGAVRVDERPAAAVSVMLSRDSNQVARTATRADGSFVFSGLAAGEYTLIVDSRTIGGREAWAEQVTAPAGGLCAGQRRENAGACPGGKRAAAPDDASGVDTAEHLAVVTLADSPVGPLDFGFSYGAVTHTGDSGQGSLRQFLENANALPGPNAMRFLPAEQAAGDEWLIRIGEALPALRDRGTVIDGGRGPDATPSAARRVGSVIRVGAAERFLENPPRPSLIIDFGGAAIGLETETDLTVRNVALRGARTHLRARGDLRLEDSVLGTLLTRAAGSSGVDVHGKAEVRRTLITGMGGPAVVVRPGGTLEADHLEVSDSGFDADARGAVVLESPRARIRHSLLLLNTGAPAVHATVVPEAVEQTTFRSNRVALAVPAATIPALQLNRFEDNIVAAAAGREQPPTVDEITMDDRGITLIRGTSSGRVEILTADAVGRLSPGGSAEAGPDGRYQVELQPKAPPRIE